MVTALVTADVSVTLWNSEGSEPANKQMRPLENAPLAQSAEQLTLNQ